MDSITRRADICSTIWRGRDPFAGFPLGLYQTDLQGWRSDHPFLRDAVRFVQGALTVVEIGVWKGGSVITMAQEMKKNKIDGVVIAVDTWLGGWDHWIQDTWLNELAFEFGYPNLYKKFVNNILSSGLQEYVVPLPLDSINAAHLLRMRNIFCDVIHIDAAHDYRSVSVDLELWWPRLKPGGQLIGDDYHTNGDWPDVRRAFDDFLSHQSLAPLEHEGGKCRIRKPTV
jgi:hypothetical protein